MTEIEVPLAVLAGAGMCACPKSTGRMHRQGQRRRPHEFCCEVRAVYRTTVKGQGVVPDSLTATLPSMTADP